MGWIAKRKAARQAAQARHEKELADWVAQLRAQRTCGARTKSGGECKVKPAVGHLRCSVHGGRNAPPEPHGSNIATPHSGPDQPSQRRGTAASA